jgi:hypothetical protein
MTQHQKIKKKNITDVKRCFGNRSSTPRGGDGPDSSLRGHAPPGSGPGFVRRELRVSLRTKPHSRRSSSFGVRRVHRRGRASAQRWRLQRFPCNKPLCLICRTHATPNVRRHVACSSGMAAALLAELGASSRRKNHCAKSSRVSTLGVCTVGFLCKRARSTSRLY